MISRIDHVSIAVKDHEKAAHFFREVLGAVTGPHGVDAETKYLWQLFSLGDLSRLEIISPTGEGSFLDGFLKSRESGVHHITLQTPDLSKAMDHLDAHGIPYFGHNEYVEGVWKEIFIHPRHAFGVLIQIAQFCSDDWLPQQVKFPADIKWQIEKTQAGAKLTFAHPGGGKVSLDLDRTELKKLTAALDQLKNEA
ncbi:MAG: VOC family protein [Smithellaceae bacterium]